MMQDSTPGKSAAKVDLAEIPHFGESPKTRQKIDHLTKKGATRNEKLRAQDGRNLRI